MIKKLFLAALILTATVCSGFAADHYVDCNLTDPETTSAGTYANPFRLISEVNAHSFATSDDVYFEVDSTCTLTAANPDRLVIDWSGTAIDKAVVGCYENSDSTVDDCNTVPYTDAARPTFTGQNVYPGQYQPLIGSDGYDHITVKDLKVINSAGYAIYLSNGDYILISNCITRHSYRVGVGLARTFYSEVSDCDISDAYYWTTVGDCLDISATAADNTSQHNLVTRNIVHECNEGIGSYQKSIHTIIEYNIVYDFYNPGIYCGAGEDVTIRYNLVYQPENPTRPSTYSRGIMFDNEEMRHYCFTGESQIHGNLVANSTFGIFLSNEYGHKLSNGTSCTAYGVPDACCQSNGYSCSEADSCNTENMQIYNNTLVDNRYNFGIRRSDAGWSGNLIENNLSYLITDRTPIHQAHIYNTEGYNGIDFDHNLYWSIGHGIAPVPTGEPATNYVISDPNILKKSGWLALTPGDLTGEEFKTLAGGAGIDAGIFTHDDYDDLIASVDFSDAPIDEGTTHDDGADMDIGAWYYGTASASAALTGTLSDGAIEAQITTGGQTLIITLTNDTWVATVGDSGAITTALIAGIDSAQAEATGWDAEVKANMVHGDVTRTSSTVVTIILAAEASYDITATETITVTIPATALTAAGELVASPTFNITPTSSSDPALAVEGGTGNFNF